MPLKLLGKKSWHVYNADNIARVRRDEAEAREREAEEERQQRAAESSRREALLRGEAVDDAADDTPEQAKWKDAARALRSDRDEAVVTATRTKPPTAASSTRRSRKRHGEDDTDYEMRLARQQIEETAASDARRPSNVAPTNEPSLVDRHGHIDLFGHEEASQKAKRNQYVDPAPDAPSSSMRMTDAAGGRDATSAWYAGEKGPTPASKPSFSLSSFAPDSARPRRPPIAAPSGLMAADPLLAMRQGAAAVRALKQERTREMDERNQTMAVLVAEQERKRARGMDRDRREHRHRDERRRRERDDDADSLDGFALDDDKDRPASYRDRRENRDVDKTHHHDRERRHHRSSRDHERSRHSRRSDYRDRDYSRSSRSRRDQSRSKERSTNSERTKTRDRSPRRRHSLSPRRSRNVDKERDKLEILS